MAIRKIAEIGHPLLKQKASPVPESEIASPKIQTLIDDLIATLRENDGVGLAAPQVYEPLRLVCVESQNNPRYPDKESFPLMILINPQITKHSSEKELDWEGCLSIPNLRGQVPRAARITVSALGRTGEPLTIKPDGFLARVIQHEYDHLEGVLFLDRMRGLSTLTNLTDWQRYWYPRYPKPSST